MILQLSQQNTRREKISVSHISGSVTPLSARALLRAAKQAMRMDSVPPLVVTPAPSEGP
jgi:hypothetical protein